MHTVLCIDDDPLVRGLVLDGLRDAGFAVLGADNGRTGIEQLGNAEVDVVITDMMMPEMDGFEFLAEMRKVKPDTPVIAVSGGYSMLPKHARTTESILRLAKEYGVFAAILKPVDVDTLAAKVHEAIRAKPAPAA